ncbi:MAG: pentapeptide repeat-containing protein [Candidatus Omnitrophica bacterium]|nr:pentapeptide repeat-containing protein [Candidatus Omnitrophota bacterium]
MVVVKDRKDIESRDVSCAKEGCRDKAISLSEFCWEHIPNKEKYKEEIIEAVLEKKLKRFNLHKAVLNDVELARADFREANLTQTNLASTNLFDTDFSNADLVGADLSGCDLTGADLSGADLTKADLSGARLWHADLSGAKLVEANLSAADFWQARLCDARLWRADISKSLSLSKKSFQCKEKRFFTNYRVYEDGYVAAEETYRNLKRYFISEGRYDDASWASFKEKTMEKIRLRKAWDMKYIPMAIMGLLCGYGERPQRIILSSSFIIIAYAAIFFLLKSITASASNAFSFNFGDYIYYSVVTFTTLGYGDIIPKTSTIFRLIAVSEAFLGAFLMGLFIFTLARKYSAR